MIIESFQQQPLQAVIPSYLYQQYADDDNLQAFVASFNSLAQGYLDWFNSTPLAVYTNHSISGTLLDWIGEGIYGITRPVLASSSSSLTAGYNTGAYDTGVYNEGIFASGGTGINASDDIYKRVLTWNLYRGDGQVFCMQWLKNRIARFLYGQNGSDYDVLIVQPQITCADAVFTVSYYASSSLTALQLAYANGALAFPFQYSMTFSSVNFTNDGGVLQLSEAISYPTSQTGLAAGSVWYNGGVICVVAGVTPDPTAAPLYFSSTTPQQLLELGGGNLPLTDPANNGQLWNNGGVISISTG